MRNRKKKVLASILGALSGTVLAVALAGDGEVQAGEGKNADCKDIARHAVAESLFESVHTEVWDQIRRSQ